MKVCLQFQDLLDHVLLSQDVIIVTIVRLLLELKIRLGQHGKMINYLPFDLLYLPCIHIVVTLLTSTIVHRLFFPYFLTLVQQLMYNPDKKLHNPEHISLQTLLNPRTVPNHTPHLSNS